MAVERPLKYEFFSKVVRAGRRTYFLDMRVTKENDFYITITESKRSYRGDGRPFYEKHKIFLYPEDFEEFTKGLSQTISYAKDNSAKIRAYSKPSTDFSKEMKFSKPYTAMEEAAQPVENYSNVDLDFEDLGNK